MVNGYQLKASRKVAFEVFDVAEISAATVVNQPLQTHASHCNGAVCRSLRGLICSGHPAQPLGGSEAGPDAVNIEKSLR